MLKKWIGRWLEETPQHSEKQIVSLNLKKTLVAHEKLQESLLYEIIGANDIPLDPKRIEKGTSCDYGQWLHSIGKKLYSSTKEYQNALKAHMELNQIAANVVYTSQTGNNRKAKKLLANDFKEASNLNQIELVRLYNRTIA